jgi:hypothetical protein
MTSSARPSNDSGTVMPSDLAVLRFRDNSIFVDCCTGSSPGFSTGGVDAGETISVDNPAAIARQAAGCDKLAVCADHGHRVPKRQRSELAAPAGQQRIAAAQHETACPQLEQVCEDPVEVMFSAGIQDMQLQAKSFGRRQYPALSACRRVRFCGCQQCRKLPVRCAAG